MLLIRVLAWYAQGPGFHPQHWEKKKEEEEGEFLLPVLALQGPSSGLLWTKTNTELTGKGERPLRSSSSIPKWILSQEKWSWSQGSINK
jgi:hypothetical protein